MPVYTFKHKKTGKIKEFEIKLSEYDQFKENHPELERIFLEAPLFNYSSGGSGSITDKAVKKDKGWGEMLAKIGEQNPNSELAQYARNKSIKRIKAETIVEKHAKKQADAARRKR